MRMNEGLRVTQSNIRAAGFGLFATRDFKKGDHIADYTGDQITLQDDQIGGPYVLAITRREGIDAARTNTGYGRWANDSRGSDYSANSEFVINRNTRTGRLKSTRNIKKGEEIFVSYGASYWKALGHQAKVLVRPAATINTNNSR